MASILRRGDSYSVRFKYKDHAGRICEGLERVLLVVPYLGKKQIQKVQTYDLEQFYATLSRTPRGLYKQGVKQTLTDKQKRQFLTGASIREVHAMLKTAFSYAVEWGLLLKSPIPREAPKSTSMQRMDVGPSRSAGAYSAPKRLHWKRPTRIRSTTSSPTSVRAVAPHWC